VASFAIVERNRRNEAKGVLMIVDTRQEAEEIVEELRSRGHDVEVREIGRPGQGKVEG
jgi:ERCC4-type nuclease